MPSHADNRRIAEVMWRKYCSDHYHGSRNKTCDDVRQRGRILNMTMPRNNVLVVGSANMDLVMRVREMPKPGETVLGMEFLRAHGGKGANQAVAAARLGAQVQFLGCLGDDAFGEALCQGLAAEGIGLSGVKRTSEEPTGTAM